jgi:transcriptional regulator with XRE-family HTH domain
MWLENLKEIKKEKKMSTKQIADKAGLPEKTVSRVLSGHTASPYIDTIDRLATALGVSISDILAGTKTVVGDSNLVELQKIVDDQTAQIEELKATNDLINAENTVLNNKINALSAEIELLKMQLIHKEELLAVHNYYIKRQS